MFDSNEMRELAHIKADRYQRAGGGGAYKVHNTARAYDDARGYRAMSSWDQLLYRTTMLWRSESRSAISGFRWDCHWLTLDKNEEGYVPF